jgi:hypothetical protein
VIKGREVFSFVQEVIQEQRKAMPARIIHMEVPVCDKIFVIVDLDRIGQMLTS